MNYPETKRPKGIILMVVLEVLFGIMGVISGLLLMADPSGELLGFPSDYKEKIPFQSFLPVGLFLFAVYGIGSFLLAYGALTRKELIFGNISKMMGRHWSWTGGIALIIALMIWLLVEGYLIGLDFAATYFTMAFGLAIFLTLVLPGNVRYFKAVS